MVETSGLSVFSVFISASFKMEGSLCNQSVKHTEKIIAQIMKAMVSSYRKSAK